MKDKDEFREVRGVVSFNCHENTTLITFEDYLDRVLTIEMPTHEFLTWFDKTTMDHALDTYTKYLKNKVDGTD